MKVLREAREVRAGPDDLVGERMERADAVAHVREHALLLDKLVDPAGEVIDRGVDERHHKHFLTRLQVRLGDKAGGQAGQGPGLPAPGNGRHAHRAALVIEDLLLLGTRLCHRSR